MTATSELDKARRRQVAAMGMTCKILGHILDNVSEQQAHDLRDGADGWSIVEIVCHLRDFDDVFHGRADMIRRQDHPQLPAYDHEAMAIDRAYQSEQVSDAFAALKDSRQRFRDFFKGLSADEWERAGVHPEQGNFSMADAAMQVVMHDLDHLEQITRVLAQ